MHLFLKEVLILYFYVDTNPNLIQFKVLLFLAKRKLMKIQETIFIFFTKHFLKIILQLVEKENIHRNP